MRTCGVLFKGLLLNLFLSVILGLIYWPSGNNRNKCVCDETNNRQRTGNWTELDLIFESSLAQVTNTHGRTQTLAFLH